MYLENLCQSFSWGCNRRIRIYQELSIACIIFFVIDPSPSARQLNAHPQTQNSATCFRLSRGLKCKFGCAPTPATLVWTFGLRWRVHQTKASRIRLLLLTNRLRPICSFRERFMSQGYYSHPPMCLDFLYFVVHTTAQVWTYGRWRRFRLTRSCGPSKAQAQASC